MVDVWQEQKSKKNIGKKKKSKGGMWGDVLKTGNKLFGFDTQSEASSLSEAIERQAANQSHLAKKEAAAQIGASAIDPFAALQDQLFSAMNGIDVAPTPLDQLRAMASGQVNAQFDPVIKALAGQMNTKEKRGKKSMGEARGMYNDLAKDFISQLPAMTQQFAAEDRATNQRYDSAQSELQKQYGAQSKEQDALMQQLGIKAAQPEASEQARDDQKYFQSQMEMDQQASLNALNEQQNAAETYQRQLGSSTRVAGENTAQDIRSQLEEYMDQANTQMSGLQSQKSQTLAALLQQLQSQDSQRVETQRQSQIDNMMNMYRFQLDAMNSSEENKARQAKLESQMNEGTFKGTSGLAGASNYLAEQYPDQPILASNLMENINDVLANKDVVRGKYTLDKGDPSLGKGPTYSDVGQEYMIDLLRREFEKEGGRYGNSDINNTINALLAYMGKLR